MDSVSLVYSIGVSSQTFDVTIREDTLAERTEFFFVRLTGFTLTIGGSPPITLMPSEEERIQFANFGTINIDDNDGK